MEVKRITLSDQVYEFIKKDIEDGIYASGDKLPSEAELSEKYNVGRSSIRAAIQKLAILGFVETKVGEGTFVNNINFFNITSYLSDFIAQESMIKHIFEFRYNIEEHCIRLAIERNKKEELKTLLYIAHNMELCAKELNLEKYLDYNYDYHYNLCKLSKNKLYEFVFSSIKDLFILSIKKNLKSRKGLETNLYNSAKTHVYLSYLIIDGKTEEACVSLDSIINFYIYINDINELKSIHYPRVSYLEYLDKLKEE